MVRSTSARVSVGFVLLLSALTALGPLTFDTYLAAFPQIADDLGTTSAAVQLTVAASLAGLALGQLLIGSISDAYGRRRPLLASLVVYILTSVGLVLASGITTFTALRFVQGFTAAAGMVLSLAIVRDRYEGLAVSKVMARLMLVVGVAPILAPTIGAQLLLLGSWRLIFVFLAAAGAALLAIASFALRESLPVDLRRTGGTVAALRTYRDLLTDLPFLGLALMSAFYLSAMFTYVASSTFVFQGGYGLTAQQFGWVFAAGAVAITAGSQVNGALVGRFRPEQVLSVTVGVGLVLGLSLFAVTLFGAPFWPVTVLVVLTMGTAGFVLPSAPAIALASNPHRAGSAAALLGALQFGLGAILAPVTSLGGEPTAVTMGAVIAGVIVVAALLLVLVRRSWARRPVEEARAVPRDPAPVDELDAVPRPA
ncbi:multidrug effflux MFS transporter [Cellulomonas fengjieae]|uniref:Multidrug effflux MFS transporter n=1 Tax=Cellulomonas fengjieae TaxID=2819978 RepID=A0ABS3SIG9_9CELL|nr:multidrug effflux MFS transporter [Cellulomonas fengjieae]MBO3085289.1 multidrug effflux MFS transporter [Cellulomonas fengjieae]MBO3101035.1 multidrug effflux MFS transporter [Cellulomonas fengjieae]QVI66151.1 multidrug effflux MFS transporter [Cellulomonas fengjieae]